MGYDVVVPSAPKDFNKLPFLYESLKYLNPQPQQMLVVVPDGTEKQVRINENSLPVSVVAESQTLPKDLNPLASKNFRRPQWIYQQFIKLFQVTSSDDYMIIDSDLFINRPLDVYNKDGKPFIMLANDQNHQPYFNYMEDVFGFGRLYPHSFISEIMYFKREYTDELLRHYCIHNGLIELFNEGREKAVRSLYHYTSERACDNWIPADYEIYGNFVVYKHPNDYSVKNITCKMLGTYQEWTDKSLQILRDEMRIRDFDVFTAHTWI